MITTDVREIIYKRDFFMFSKKNVNKVENSWKSDFYDRCCLDNECTDMYSAAARMERKEA